MKKSNSKERIKELMQFYGINQTELCRRTGIQKSALSNYLNGDREPRQDQISLIADPFNVNPAWLMGYDVPMLMSSVSSKEVESSSGTKYYFSDETAAVAQEIFESQDLRALFDAARDADPKDLKMAADMLKRFKETNPDG